MPWGALCSDKRRTRGLYGGDGCVSKAIGRMTTPYTLVKKAVNSNRTDLLQDLGIIFFAKGWAFAVWRIPL